MVAKTNPWGFVKILDVDTLFLGIHKRANKFYVISPTSDLSNFYLITFLGANSLFGRVASALLSRTPSVRTLKLYDEVDKPELESTSVPTCLVQWHHGKEELTFALESPLRGPSNEQNKHAIPTPDTSPSEIKPK
ncbi:unnamed protein product [Nezara viridula]|uniref:Uncharacterized protein n=1 Tax=Nezara viridula TaxID=85310 RepID=A0A9P0HM91_NEZVI|nr:unnamed protein product [Nezara viridula]